MWVFQRLQLAALTICSDHPMGYEILARVFLSRLIDRSRLQYSDIIPDSQCGFRAGDVRGTIDMSFDDNGVLIAKPNPTCLG